MVDVITYAHMHIYNLKGCLTIRRVNEIMYSSAVSQMIIYVGLLLAAACTASKATALTDNSGIGSTKDVY